jgi:hypothetical protein
MPVLLFVGAIVVAHAVLLLTDEVALEFELFTAVFFSLEVALRIYALTPYYYFVGNGTWRDFDHWINILDFVLSVVDVISLGVHLTMPTEDTHEAVRVGSHAVDLFGKAASKSTHLMSRMGRIPLLAAKTGRLTQLVLRTVRICRLWRLVRVCRHYWRHTATKIRDTKLDKPLSWMARVFESFDFFQMV